MSDELGSRLESVEGEVKWFDPRKGFGFIIGPDGQDVFVHFSVIEGDGFKALKDHARVEYDADRSDRGWKATRVARSEAVEISVMPRRTPHTRTPRR
jgi:CspA family cold shock protein